MQAAHYRQPDTNEWLGLFVLAGLGLAALLAFAFSPLGTVAALIVGAVAYALAGRDDAGNTTLRVVERLSLVCATLGVLAAFALF